MKINQVLGINLGKNMDQLQGKDNPAIIFKNARRFFNLEDIYKDKDRNSITPASREIKTYDVTCETLVPDLSDGWTSFHDTIKRYNCDYHQFDHTILALQYIAPDGPAHMRFFPSNNLNPDELGATARKQTANALQMGEILKKHINADEITLNEHWRTGYEPTYKAFQKGLLMSQTKDFRVNSQALQFHNPKEGHPLFNNYGHDYLTKDEISQTNAFTNHPYGFTNGQGGQPSDLKERPETSVLQQFKDLKDFRDKNNPKAKLYASEIGWNSEIVGEVAQGEYLIISLLLAMNLGYDKMHIYELIDRPENPLFNSCGLGKIVNNEYVPKRSYFIIKDFLETFGEFSVGPVVNIGDEWSVDLIPPSEEEEIIVISWNTTEEGFHYESESEITNNITDEINSEINNGILIEKEIAIVQTAIGIVVNQDIMAHDPDELTDRAIEVAKKLFKKLDYGKE